MIFEYALEPQLLSNWSRFQRVVGLFGITKGRLISRYPKRWARLVYDSVPSGTTEKSKIEIALKRVERDLLLPRNHQWDDAIDWLTNAIAEHGRAPFQAILAGGPHANVVVIDANDLDSTDLPPLLHAGPSRIVARDASEIGKAVRSLLLVSKKVLLVEPNFTIKSPRFQDPLAAILMAALDLQMRVRPDAEVELHLGMDKLDEYPNKQGALDAFLRLHVPERMNFTVVGWHKDDIHNRYLVTDRFGISIGEGFGLPDEKSSRTVDVLAVLDAATAARLMTQYSDKAKHKLSHRIVGAKRVAQ